MPRHLIPPTWRIDPYMPPLIVRMFGRSNYVDMLRGLVRLSLLGSARNLPQFQLVTLQIRVPGRCWLDHRWEQGGTQMWGWWEIRRGMHGMGWVGWAEQSVSYVQGEEKESSNRLSIYLELLTAYPHPFVGGWFTWSRFRWKSNLLTIEAVHGYPGLPYKGKVMSGESEKVQQGWSIEIDECVFFVPGSPDPLEPDPARLQYSIWYCTPLRVPDAYPSQHSGRNKEYWNRWRGVEGSV